MKQHTVTFYQDEIELLSELLKLEEQERHPMFENVIDDAGLSNLSLKIFKLTFRGEALIKELKEKQRA